MVLSGGDHSPNGNILPRKMVTFALPKLHVDCGSFRINPNTFMKTLKHLVLLAIALAFTTGLSAQKDSDVLFTVANEPVTVGEFRYIYTKTNGDKADFSKESVMEYMDLYQRFKLKVARAKAMGLDTIEALQNELAGYRRQLADNYLEDKQVTRKLVEQLYERQKTDVSFSHILFRFKGNPTQRDIEATKARAAKVMEGVTPENFAEQAKQWSEDGQSKESGGRIGYVAPPFPKGLHRLEAALYDAADNTVVGPVRSAAGYHLLLKHDNRPARGEMEVAHILVRKATGAKGEAAQKKVAAAQAALASGQSFEDVARKFSEDKKTAKSGGYLGFFGINRYDPAFEEAAFALTEDGQVSKEIETSAGYHFIQRISQRSVQPLADIRPLLEKKIKADGRFADAQKQMLVDLRDKYEVQVDEAAFGRYAATLVDSSFLDFRWKPDASSERGPLISFADGTRIGLETFQEYLKKNNRKRVSLGRNSNSFTVANRLFEEWVDNQIITYAEGRLEKDYPDFAALMREYREGILLFEATKMEVWDKASADTTGLQTFFANHRGDYLFEERAEITQYVLNVGSGLNAQEVYDFASQNGRQAAVEKFGDNVLAKTSTLGKEELQKLGLSRMKVGVKTPLNNDVRKRSASFYKVEKVLPARQKELKEARGYVIADYQDQLEREWVARLRDEFPIKVNKKVFNKLVKS